VNCGFRSNFLYIAIPFYFYSHCLLSCILLSYYHLICSILCLQQTGEIDNLIVSWEQSSWLCCVQVSRCCWVKTHQQYSWRHCPKCHKASKHHLLKFGFLLLVRQTLVSQLRKDLLPCSSYLPLGVPNELFLQAINEFSGAVAGEEEDFCKGSLARTIFYFVFFALFYFCLHRFIKNTKN
jgi:hypothetical protein